MKYALPLHPLQSTAIRVFAYFLVSLGVYFWGLGVIDMGLISFPKSLKSIFWLLVAAGLGVGMVAEGILLLRYRKDFGAVLPKEIDRLDLIKTTINFFLTLFFSWMIYLFVFSRQPNLEDPLAFVAVASFVYLGTAAICQHIRYIPLYVNYLRRKHERI